MPHITTEKVRELRNALKARFPGVKFSLVREHHSAIRCAIMESPFEFERPDMALNHFECHLKDHHKGKPYLNFLLEVSKILTNDVREVSYDGDYGSIPTYYVTMQVGKWDKPHITNKKIKVS